MELPLTVVLRDDGSADPGLDPGLDGESLVFLFKKMVFLRALDEKALNLQRAGRIGFYIGATGQEAAEIGSGFALRPGDWLFPSYRDHGVALLHGYPLSSLVGQLFGNQADTTKGRQMPNHWCDPSVRVVSVSSPVATQLPQAVGAAYAAKLRGEKNAFIAYFGDGGSSTGEFHVGMNFAGVFSTPNVFFCSNNQYAISVPVSKQTASSSIAVKAAAYGFPGIRVDGNDVLAVYRVTRDAMERARAGDGPTLIEALTYRMGAHSTSDDPTRYRPAAEVEDWGRRDPIERFAAHLKRLGLLADGDREAFAAEAQEEVRLAVAKAEAAPPVPPESLLEDVYADMPWHLSEQRGWLREPGRG